MGSGEASRRFEGLPPFGGVGVLGRLMKRGQRRKKEGVTRNHGFPYRKEGRDSLPGSTVETPQNPAVTGLGVSISKNLIDQGRCRSFEGESLKCQGLFQPARAWRFF